MTTVLYTLLFAVGLFYATWVFYLAIMNLARAKRDGKLSRVALVLGTPLLFVGLLFNVALNALVMTVLFLELPREPLTSMRLKRHNQGAGWRRRVAQWFEPLLDPYDPDGDHI